MTSDFTKIMQFNPSAPFSFVKAPYSFEIAFTGLFYLEKAILVGKKTHSGQKCHFSRKKIEFFFSFSTITFFGDLLEPQTLLQALFLVYLTLNKILLLSFNKKKERFRKKISIFPKNV